MHPEQRRRHPDLTDRREIAHRIVMACVETVAISNV
jgi:hypothetical protein